MTEAIVAHREQEDRGEIRGWMMYDWANSAFSTTVVTTLLGPYLASIAKTVGGVQVFGFSFEPDAFFPTCVSISVILQVLFLPLLGTIADYSSLKKRLLLTFAFIGAIATTLLFFIQADMPLLGANGAVLLAGLLFIIANLAFGAAIVFYNAFLPDITAPEDRDRVSSQGWALGYLGGGILLALNLVLIQLMADTALAVRLSLASAGVWWLVFTVLFPARRLRQRPALKRLPSGVGYFRQGVRQILKTLGEIRGKYPETLRYLIAYLIYNDGIQTVIVVATLFATTELKAEPDDLIILVLLIQFVAFGGALFFGWLARKLGAKRSIVVSLVIWSVIAIAAYALLYEMWQLYVLGIAVAIVLGGSQALSRSLYSQVIPRSNESEYFGFYEISERGTSWIGPLLFALAVQLTGSTRIAVLSVIVFFVVGLILLIPFNVRKAMLDSGNNPEGVVL
ncbi:MAG: MFS transporter [Caldilineales bacterium]|nr:MFS transporter [Caldilineales bacterium]MCW5860276.1 MFS transporter [Caldilineales bacterium]